MNLTNQPKGNKLINQFKYNIQLTLYSFQGLTAGNPMNDNLQNRWAQLFKGNKTHCRMYFNLSELKFIQI
jgi:hypothetical protein